VDARARRRDPPRGGRCGSVRTAPLRVAAPGRRDDSVLGFRRCDRSPGATGTPGDRDGSFSGDLELGFYRTV
jgi:hypothetical protein